jgi:hypothetical protein
VRALADGVHVIGEPVQSPTDTTIAHAIVAALDTISDRPECVPGVRGITSEVLTSGVLT